MGSFEYTPVDTTEVRDVTIVPRDDPGYRSFMSSIYDSGGSDPTYKQWARDYPDLAHEYKRLADRALEDPERLADELDDEIYGGHHDDFKELHGDIRYAVLPKYPDHAERYSQYGIATYDGELTERTVHRTTFGLIDDLRGRSGAEDQRKACLAFAFSETFETADHVSNNTFNTSREEALLQHLGSDHTGDSSQLGQGGKEFEQRAREALHETMGLPLRDRVFRIQLDDGTITYKEMDVHTRIGATPIIIELFTSRVASEKRKQLENYRELYQIATGFEADGYLVTDEIIEWVSEDDGSLTKVTMDTDQDMYSFTYFYMEYLPEEYGLETPDA